jgi:phosphoadenosine phosphosulfate reductase
MTAVSHDEVAALAASSEELSAERLIGELTSRFGDRVSLACSFQKEESVLLDLLFAAAPKARVFAIDTHYLFPETYELWREVEQRYDTTIEVFEGPTPEELAATHGEKLWETKPDL